MKSNRITGFAYLNAVIICSLSGCVFAQPDSASIDTFISRVYIQFLDAAQIDIPDEFDIYIIKSDTAYSIAERVIDSAGAHMLWVFDLHPARHVANCEYKPHIIGFESELMGSPNIEQEGNEWIARCAFRLKKIWQVEVESEPVGVKVKNLNLEVSQYTDFMTPPMPWDELLKLEFYCSPISQDSYSIELRADDLFNLPDGMVQSKDFIKDRMFEATARDNLNWRTKVDKSIKTKKIIIKPKRP